MYEKFYNLREKPFSLLPDAKLIYWATAHRLAYAMLEFGLLNAAGFTVITGEIGSGKTTLVRYLLRRLPPDVTVGLLTHSKPGAENLLRWILMALGLPFEDASYVSLYKRFTDFIQEQHARGRRTLLIVDEAQNLGAETLEDLRMLSNVNADKDQLLQLILVGQPQLRDELRKPELEQFAQRVSSDFHLVALGVAEVRDYISYRLKAVGGDPALFSADACDMVARASRGLPRSINVICDTALVYGFAANLPLISSDIVQSVLANKRKFGVFHFGDVSS